MTTLPSSVSPRTGTAMMTMSSNPNMMTMNTIAENDSKPIDLELFKGKHRLMIIYYYILTITYSFTIHSSTHPSIHLIFSLLVFHAYLSKI
jgi:hypothetical protein